MISYIKGIVSEITEGVAVVDVNGIGYSVLVSAKAAGRMSSIGSEVKLYTYMSVREDAIKLYGFLTRDELEFFRLLISVNKVGPKGAQDILAFMEPDELRMCILSSDAKTLAKCPGVGAKTAQRIILDLKDKVDIGEALTIAAHGSVSSSFEGSAKDEAMQALIALGFASSECLSALNKVEGAEAMDTEELIKAALKYMG